MSGFGSRGDYNIFRDNEVRNCKGAGIRVGGHKKNDVQYGIGNWIYRNTLENNDYAGIKITV